MFRAVLCMGKHGVHLLVLAYNSKIRDRVRTTMIGGWTFLLFEFLFYPLKEFSDSQIPRLIFACQNTTGLDICTLLKGKNLTFLIKITKCEIFLSVRMLKVASSLLSLWWIHGSFHLFCWRKKDPVKGFPFLFHQETENWKMDGCGGQLGKCFQRAS